MQHKSRSVGLILVLNTMLLVAGSAMAQKPASPRDTVLPIYPLPSQAAADGKLGEWGAVPPVPATMFKPASRQQTITPSDSFAPTLRCGRKSGSDDLYFLVIVKDSQQYTEDSPHWMAGDYLEFYLDFGREVRDRTKPQWFKTPKDWHTPPGMGQFGFRPRTLQVSEKLMTSARAGNWKVDYASVPVEGGLAYEIRLDGSSVLNDLGLKEMPPYIGIDLGLADQDYMARLVTDGWANDNGLYRLFGDGMDHAFPVLYGMLSTQVGATPSTQPIEALPKTLPELFGESPTPQDIKNAIGKMPSGRLADLITWAGCQGAVFDAALVKDLMATGSPQVREKCLAVLYFADQDKSSAKAALDIVYTSTISDESPYVLTLANLLDDRHGFDYRQALRGLLSNKDLTVAFTAARALAKTGTAEDLAFMDQTLEKITANMQPPAPGADAKIEAGRISAYRFYFGMARETLLARTETITIPSSTPLRQIESRNTDLERFIPVDGNNVYNAKGLLRSWPKEGPKELWRIDVGPGKSAVVEAGGHAFSIAQAEGKQWALCLDALSGKTAWKVALADVDAEPIATPVIDGDRVYFLPATTRQEEGVTVVCLQTADGKEVWRGTGDLELVESSSTPLIVGDVLYCPLYRGKDAPLSPLAAVDKMTGKVLWKTPPTGRRGSGISSPTYQIIDGIPQIILSVYSKPMNEVWGISAKTGEVFWRYSPNAHYGLIPSPVTNGSRVFICDGIPPFSACLQMYVRDGQIKARQVYRDDRLQANLYNTVAIADGAVYGFCNSALQCTRLDDGKLLWKKAGKDWAGGQQLIIADGLLIALSGSDIIMGEASPTGCKEVGRVKHGVTFVYPQQPTIANGRLYVRGDKAIVCYDLINPR